MKKIRHFAAVLCISACFAGCSRQLQAETDRTVPDIAAAVMESQTKFPEQRQITSKEDGFSLWMEDYYSVSPEQVEEGFIYYADGAKASEIAVLLLENADDSEAVQKALEEYIRNRASVFAGYAPQEAAMAEEGTVAVKGRYLAMMICPDVSAAQKAFFQCFENEGETPKIPTEGESSAVSTLEAEARMEAGGEEEIYDSKGVLEAWRSGDASSLSEMNRTILDAARDVIDQEIDDQMSDYEKELAIHDWITGWSSFDYSVFGRSDQVGFEAGSDTPYGVLIGQSAMCHGYSSTFQLFMDMLDIECITVFGNPGDNGVEHSWNMVKLDGEWYCVDTAWDDPIGGRPGHRFFNVTSQTLRESGIHRWDESSVPEAEGTVYAYGNQ